MKKIYSLCLILLCLFGINQTQAQTILLDEDFSGGALPVGWTNTGTGGSWTFSSAPILSGITLATNSVANGYAVFNSDVLGNDGLTENVDLITSSFSCLGQNTVFLAFQDVFAQFATSSGTVAVSVNNGPWVTVYTVGPGIPQDNINGNPNFENINISAQAANQANVRIRFKYQGDWDYWWVVDDIIVYAPAAFDAALISGSISEYTSVPLSQVTPYTPSCTVLNNGGNPLTGVSVATTITAGSNNAVVYNATMTQASLAVAATSTLTASTSFTPTTTDFYIVQFVVSVTQADAIAANDTFITAINVDDSLYARDFFLLTNSVNDLGGPWFVGAANNGQLGNVFRAQNATTLVSAVATFGGGFAIGDQTQANLFSMNGNLPGTLIASSPVLTVSAADTPVIFYEFFFPAGTNLAAGTDYLITVQQNAASAANFGLYSSTRNYTANKAFIRQNTAAWQEIDASGIGQETFMIRANTYTAPVVTCSITGLAAGTQTPCVAATNQYTQNVTVTYTNPPTSGMLNVNGQMFAITSSPQTVTLTGLNSNGAAVNVSASFTANASCSLSQNALFTAPANCQAVCTISGLTAGVQTPCVNTNNTYTQQVTVTYSTPPTTGMLSVNGQMFAITSSPQTVTLIGLNSNGQAVNVSASFTANTACNFAQNALFTAPASCLCPTISVNVTTVSNSNCSTPNGSATANVTGGAAIASYAWTPSNFGSGATINGLPSGSYSVIVTDVNGCAGSGSGSVGNTAGVNAVVGNVLNPTCNAGANGVITINATGGTTPISYTWSDQGFATANFSRSNLSAGSYTVIVTDAGGCSVNLGPIVLTAPPALTATLTSQTNVSCNGGNNGLIDMTVSGGTAPYTQTWTNSTATTADLSGLTAGTYQLSVVDANNCPVVTGPQVTITEPAPLAISVIGATDVSCNGGSDGMADVTVTGGTPGYTYNWGAGNTTTEDLNGASAGNYQLVVTDANLCTLTSSSIAIDEPGALVLSTSSTEESSSAASDGTASVSSSGGTSPYTFLWDDASAQTNSTATGLNAGNYNVTVTDANGCSETASVLVDLGSGIQEITLQDFTVYPNPANKSVIVTFEVEKNADYTVSFYNTIGNLLLTDKASVNSQYKKSFDISALAAGVYFVEIQSEAGKAIKKLTVTK